MNISLTTIDALLRANIKPEIQIDNDEFGTSTIELETRGPDCIRLRLALRKKNQTKDKASIFLGNVTIDDKSSTIDNSQELFDYILKTYKAPTVTEEEILSFISSAKEENKSLTSEQKIARELSHIKEGTAMMRAVFEAPETQELVKLIFGQIFGNDSMKEFIRDYSKNFASDLVAAYLKK